MEEKAPNRTPLESKEGEVRLLSSIFIARLFPCASVEDFKKEEEAFRKAHPKADHYPSCLNLPSLTRSSDDGEPGGSAGRPLLSLLQEKNIVNAGILVARYFGGSKLGIPRLRRSFLDAATQAIENTRFGVEVIKYSYSLELDYPTYDRLNNLSKDGYFSIEVEDFGIKVLLKLQSRSKIDSLLEKKGIYLPLPSPETIIALEEENP